MIETAIDPTHPSRLEKKANIVAGSSWIVPNAAVLFCESEIICFVEAYRSK